MSTSRPVKPGETIPLEQFSAHIKQRARLLSAIALKAEGMRPVYVDQILNTPDDVLRTVQRGEKLTFDELDDYLLKKFVEVTKPS